MVEDENKHGESERAESYLPGCVRYSLPSGDYGFDGRGPGNRAILVGLERKKTTDLAHCVAQTSHHLAQLRRMVNDYHISYLLWEGAARADADGLLETMMWNQHTKRMEWTVVTPKIKYSRLDKHLETISETLGVRVRRSANYRETCQKIIDLAEWWQDPPERHTSALAFPQQFNPSNGLGPINLVARMAKELDGVGWETAAGIGERFEIPREMHEASVREWMELPGAHDRATGEILRRLTARQVGEILRQWHGAEVADAMMAKWEMGNSGKGGKK